MRLMVCAVALCCVTLLSADDKNATTLSENAQKELKPLQGKWAVKKFETAGEKTESDELTVVLEIKGTKWFEDGKELAEFSAIDPETDPKCFDIKKLDEGEKNQVIEAIYKLDGDTLTICMHEGKQKQRPTQFETSPQQPEVTLAVLIRLKSDE